MGEVGGDSVRLAYLAVVLLWMEATKLGEEKAEQFVFGIFPANVGGDTEWLAVFVPL